MRLRISQSPHSLGVRWRCDPDELALLTQPLHIMAMGMAMVVSVEVKNGGHPVLRSGEPDGGQTEEAWHGYNKDNGST